MFSSVDTKFSYWAKPWNFEICIKIIKNWKIMKNIEEFFTEIFFFVLAVGKNKKHYIEGYKGVSAIMEPPKLENFQ